MANFNLAAPPGFRGLDRHLPFRRYERHLPHWRQDGATYFVTFRLADALPQEKLDFLRRVRAEWERTHPPPRSEQDWTAFAKQYTEHVERWTDEGHGACWFQYIGQNAFKAGLPVEEVPRWIHPDWQAAGWRFIDP